MLKKKYKFKVIYVIKDSKNKYSAVEKDYIDIARSKSKLKRRFKLNMKAILYLLDILRVKKTIYCFITHIERI